MRSSSTLSGFRQGVKVATFRSSTKCSWKSNQQGSLRSHSSASPAMQQHMTANTKAVTFQQLSPFFSAFSSKEEAKPVIPDTPAANPTEAYEVRIRFIFCLSTYHS